MWLHIRVFANCHTITGINKYKITNPAMITQINNVRFGYFCQRIYFNPLAAGSKFPP